jgi:signal transduction histidine kinase
MRRPHFGWLHARSLRTRFGLWAAGLVLVAVILLGVFVYIDVARSLRNSLDEGLRLSASLAASTMDVTDGGLVLHNSLPQTNTQLDALLAQGTTVRYLTSAATILGGFGFGWNSAPDTRGIDAARTGHAAYSQFADSKTDRDYRVYTLPLTRNGAVAGFVQVVRDLHSVAETLGDLLAALFAGGVLVMIAGGLGAYFLARRALAPIETITRLARQISAHDLSARLSVSDAHEEVGQLADTFDDMLNRLEDSFARERRFTADASHELRTPLAAMDAILDVIRAEPRSPAEYHEALDDLAAETARLRALAEDLLRLARGSQIQPAAFAPVNISLLAQDVADALRPLAEAKALELEIAAEPNMMVLGDSDSLIRVLLNLVDNAIKFTERGTVTIRTYSKGESAFVDVTDTGIGIPPDSLAGIFERFCRVDPDRSSPGAGLGLALASQIVRSHGGTLTVDSAQGSGSTFSVGLSLAQPAR